MSAFERAKRLVDPYAVQKDASYRATVETFRRWFEMTEMAMEDEGVDPRVTARVLDRLAYGTPSGADAYERMEAREAEILRRTISAEPSLIVLPTWNPSVHPK